MKNLLEKATNRFETFLDSTLVARPHGYPKLTWPHPCHQVFTQNEILLRLIAKFKNRTSCLRNVLTFGFTASSCYNTTAQSAVHFGLDYSYPNFMVNQLKSSNWIYLLSIIGDAVMQILLEKYALFMIVKPSACIQLTGTVIYDLIPPNSWSSLKNSSDEFKGVRIKKRTYPFVDHSKEVPTKKTRLGAGQSLESASTNAALKESTKIKPLKGYQSNRESGFLLSSTSSTSSIDSQMLFLANQDCSKKEIETRSVNEVKTEFAVSDQNSAVSPGVIGENYKKWVPASGQTKKLLDSAKFPDANSSLNSGGSSNNNSISNTNTSSNTNNNNSIDGNTSVSNVGTGSNNNDNSCTRNISNSNLTPISLSNSNINSSSDFISKNVTDNPICNINIDTNTNTMSSNVTYTNYSNTSVTSLNDKVSITYNRNSNTTSSTSKNNDNTNGGSYSSTNTGVNDFSNINDKSSVCSNSIARGNDSNNGKRNSNGVSNIDSSRKLLCQPNSTIDGWRSMSMVTDHLHGEVLLKTTKRTRRGKRSCSSIISHCPLLNLRFNPYCYSQPISHFSLLYCKNMSQKPFKKDITFGCRGDNLSNITDFLFKDIFERTFVGASKKDEVSLYCNGDHSVAFRSFSGMPSKQFPSWHSQYSKNKVPVVVEKITRTVSPSECHKCQLKNFLMAKTKPLLEKMVNKHRNCYYLKILDHHCAINTANAKTLNTKSHLRKKTLTSHPNGPHQSVGSPATNHKSCDTKSCHLRKTLTIGKLLNDNVSHQQVYIFLKSCIRHLVPAEFFGSNHNQNLFFKHVKSFVSLGKYEKVCVGEIMDGMKTSCCAWLKKIPSQSWRSMFFTQFIIWLFNKVILTLIKDCFYVTDSSHCRNRLFYYRKPVWSRVKKQAINNLISSEMMSPMKEACASQMIKEGSSLGISTLRFLPKGQSLRTITNMNSKAAPNNSKNRLTIKKQLSALFCVLNSIKDLYPSYIGCSVFGVDDIYQKWRQFLKTRNESKDERCLYFVKVDIKKCFDSINHDVLMEILTDAIKQDSGNFIIRKYAMVYLAKKKPKRKFLMSAQDFNHCELDFKRFAHSKMMKSNLHDVILTDKVEYEYLEETELLSQLYSHIIRNIIKINSRYYLQKIGISQGSVLSILLCNFYYGHMERSLVEVRSDELMMRLVDDYLFVTPDKTRAVNFLETFLTGISQYNCYIQLDKLLINFHYIHPQHGQIHSLQQTDMMPWCGLLINMASLEIMKDYSKYCGISISDTVSTVLSHHPGASLQESLLRFLKPKCQMIFVDKEINTLGTIINNVFNFFYLIAYRFHAHIRRFPSKGRVAANPNFFFECIEEIADCFKHQIHFYMKKMNGQNCYPLNKLENKWLCFMAFDIKLSCYCSLYHKLCKILQMYFTQTKHLLSKKRYKLLMEVKEAGVSQHFKLILD